MFAKVHRADNHDQERREAKAAAGDQRLTRRAVGEKATRQHADDHGDQKKRQAEIAGRLGQMQQVRQRDDHIGLQDARAEVQHGVHDGQQNDRGRQQRQRGRALRRAGFRSRAGAIAFAAAIGHERQGHQRANQAADDQGRARAAEMRRAKQNRRRDREAEIAHEGVDREGAPHAGLRHLGRQNRIVRRMIDGVRQTDRDRGDDQHGIGGPQADGGESRAAHEQAADEQGARTQTINQKPGRRLRQRRDDVHQRHRQREVGVGNVKEGLEVRQQGNEGDPVKVTDEMRRGHQTEGLVFGSHIVRRRECRGLHLIQSSRLFVRRPSAGAHAWRPRMTDLADHSHLRAARRACR